MKGLSKDFNVIRTMLLERDNLSYRQCCSRLLDHAAFMKMEASTGSAYYGQKKSGGQSSSQKSGGEGLKNVRCYSCGEKGHVSSQCKANPKEKRTTICYNCKEPGHIAPNCPKKKQNDREKVSFLAVAQPQALVTIEECQTGQANNVMVNKNEGDGWIVDSDATHHMCKDREAFVTTSKVKKWKENSIG